MMTLIIVVFAGMGAYVNWHEAKHLNDLDKRLK